MTNYIIYKNHRIYADPKANPTANTVLPRVIIIPPDDSPEEKITLEYIGSETDSLNEAVRIAHNLGRAYVDVILEGEGQDC